MNITTSYFADIATIEAIAKSEKAIIQACENFQKQTARSRCQIMTAGGVRTLSVPTVHRSGEKIPIREVEVDYTMPWRRNHWRTITAAYASSPYWEHFAAQIEPLFEIKHRFLFDMNLWIMERVLEILKIKTTIELSTHFEAPSPITYLQTPYYQVFSETMPFQANLSILDAIFCVGRLPSAE